jgi:septum formation protein
VALGRTIYGKPQDAKDARRMLTQLAGTRHRVLTAVAVQPATARGLRVEAVSTSYVSFDTMSPGAIRAYVATGEPMGKAGAYAVQGRAVLHITHISGSYSGIMGLPLRETALLLRAAGLKI